MSKRKVAKAGMRILTGLLAVISLIMCIAGIPARHVINGKLTYCLTMAYMLLLTGSLLYWACIGSTEHGSSKAS